jgi:hypothetical protein
MEYAMNIIKPGKSASIVLLAVLPLLAQAQETKPATPAAAPTAKAAPAAQSTQAGELVLVTGRVTTTGPGGSRSLGKGDPVFVGDTLLVGPNSYANIKFHDGGRVLLRPNTDFTVEAYKYTAPVPAAGGAAAPAKGREAVPQQQAFFRLLRGGFRAVSGLIRGDQQTYRVTTPVATIGIRGTDYEAQICTNDCPSQGKAGLGGTEVASLALEGLELAQAGGPPSNQGGLLLATNEGTVVMKTGRGEYLVKVGEVAFALSNGQVLMLPVVPDALLPYSNTSPQDCE